MNIFKGLEGIESAKVTVSVADNSNNGVNLETHPKLRLTKGCLSVEVTFYGIVYPFHLDNDYLAYESNDYEENSFSINGVKVDNMQLFLKGLGEHGLSSVANSLNISHDDYMDAITEFIPTMPEVKKLYKGKKMFSSLSEGEKQQVIINYAIKNYEAERSILSHLRTYKVIGMEDTLPTMDELEDMVLTNI